MKKFVIFKIFKWTALCLSIACFSCALFTSLFTEQTKQHEEKEPDYQITLQEEISEESDEAQILPTDCKGIINAFEQQADKDPADLPAGLTENYYDCIENLNISSSASSSNSSKEKKDKKEK